MDLLEECLLNDFDHDAKNSFSLGVVNVNNDDDFKRPSHDFQEYPYGPCLGHNT